MAIDPGAFSRIKVIGKGEYGVVWLCNNLAGIGGDKSQIVEKEIGLSLDSAEDAEQARRDVETEVNALCAVSSPFIIRYLGHFYDENNRSVSILTAFAPNGTLRDQVKRARDDNRPLPGKVIVKWFLELCIGLQQVHGKKILHRDLKSENVFIGSRGEAILGDFGVSRQVLSGQYAQTVTGTPYYMSPELLMENPRYNYKSDLWSVGCLLFEMITLRRPFIAKDFMSLSQKILNLEYPRIKPAPAPQPPAQENLIIANDVPAVLYEYVERLLTIDPNQRPEITEILARPELAAARDEITREFSA